MSLFKNIFNRSETKITTSNFNWKHLTDLGQLKEIIELSFEKPILIFKHSTRCSISKMALNQFESDYDLKDKIELYYLDLIENRLISNEVAKVFGVVHQSPQILLIRDGKSIFNASHESIDAMQLGKFVD